MATASKKRDLRCGGTVAMFSQFSGKPETEGKGMREIWMGWRKVESSLARVNGEWNLERLPLVVRTVTFTP